MKHYTWLIAVLIVIFSKSERSHGGFAITPLESMNLVSLDESLSSTLYELNQIGVFTYPQILDWNGTYSETGWTYSVMSVLGNEAINLNGQGSLSGQLGENVTITFSTTGNIGAEPINVSGTSTWLFDSPRND